MLAASLNQSNQKLRTFVDDSPRRKFTPEALLDFRRQLEPRVQIRSCDLPALPVHGNMDAESPVQGGIQIIEVLPLPFAKAPIRPGLEQDRLSQAKQTHFFKKYEESLLVLRRQISPIDPDAQFFSGVRAAASSSLRRRWGAPGQCFQVLAD